MKNSKTKLAIIGTVGVPARYGGFETLAHQLVLHLNQRLDITVFNSTKHYSAKERVKEWNGAKIKYIPLSANGFQSIFYDIFSMIYALFVCDVLLVLGVSGALFIPFAKLFAPRKKIIVNVDGLEWRRPKWNAMTKWFLRLNEKIVAKYADEIVADNAAIQKYMYDCYGLNANLVAYGADHNTVLTIKPSTLVNYPFLQNEYAFKVARIEPENNIKMVLEAFSQQDELPLVLVGNWNNSDYGMALRKEYAHYKNLYLLDPIYNADLLNQLRSNAKIYIHGHSEGGTNPSLVEAMYLGLPILSFDVVYNRITTDDHAFYFENIKELLLLLDYLDQLNLDRIAAKLKQVANEKYLWSIISDNYAAIALGGLKKPIPVFNFELPFKLQQAVKA